MQKHSKSREPETFYDFHSYKIFEIFMTQDMSTLVCIPWESLEEPSCSWIDYSIKADDSKLMDGALTGQPYFLLIFCLHHL